MIALTNTICETRDTVVVVFSNRTPHAVDHKAIAVYSFANYGQAVAFANQQEKRPDCLGVVVQTVDGIKVYGTDWQGRPQGQPVCRNTSWDIEFLRSQIPENHEMGQ